MLKNKTHYLALAALYLIGIVLLFSTSPDNLPVWALIIPFCYVFTVIYATCHLVLARGAHRSATTRIAPTVIAGVATLLLLLSSLHQMNTRDILLASSIVLLLIWYLRKVS